MKPAMFDTILIANRGEIACRVIADVPAHGHSHGCCVLRCGC